MFPFPTLWGCKYTDNILIFNNFINNNVGQAETITSDWRIYKALNQNDPPARRYGFPQGNPVSSKSPPLRGCPLSRGVTNVK